MADTTPTAVPAPHSTPPSPSISDKARLASLIAQATAKYAIKDYIPAAEYYSQATELQAELNGEMAVENADLLYSYGKCLYFVAVKNSDVLGGEAAGAKLGSAKPGQGKKGKKVTNGRAAEPKSDTLPSAEGEQRQAEEVVAALVEEKAGGEATDEKVVDESGVKPLFQFTGDENWDDSDEDEDGDGAPGEDDAAPEEEQEEQEDDFANAFEVLDLARVLFKARLQQLQDQASAAADKGKSVDSNQDPLEERTVKERIADIHDLQAEIALEGERFSNAVVDLKGALALKEELFPSESPVLAECHYKLSLALEFSSVTQQRDKDGNPEGEAKVDQEARDEAAAQMYKAIESCKLRVLKEEQELKALEGEEMAPKRAKLRLDIEDVKEMIGDMQLRLVELKKPPVSIHDPKGTGTLDGSTPLNGILGQILGESNDEQKKRLEEASLSAKDLTGLVKRKKAKSPAADEKSDASNTTTNNGRATNHGKRKAVDFVEEAEEMGNGKKAKVDEATTDA